MPRTTRAAAMRNNIHEDAADPADPADVPLPATPQRERETRSRAPLGEIVVNQVEQQAEEQPRTVILEVDLSKPAKKAKSGKGKKEKGSAPDRSKKDASRNKKTDQNSYVNKENIPVVVPEVEEDECQSSASSAVDEACETLRKKFGKAKSAHEKIRSDEPRTPLSKAARAARKQLSPKPQTPHFNPAIHRSRDSGFAVENTLSRGGEEDSFVKSIETRSPAKHATAEVHLGAYEAKEELEERTATAAHKGAEDSLRVAQPDDLCSPPKSYQRIEDSVEALDALEDAIEKLGESLPAIADEPPQSPVKSRKEAMEKCKTAKSTTAVQRQATSQATITTTSTSAENSVRIKSAPAGRAEKKPIASGVDRKNATVTTAAARLSKPAPGRKISPSTKAAGSATQPKPVVTRRPVTKPIETHLAIRRKPSESLTKVGDAATSTSKSNPTPTRPIAAKRRVSSLSKAPFVPVKSTKPPTTSTFSLPGEAVSAKLKAAREEREAAATTTAASPFATFASPLRTAKMPIGGSMRVKPTVPRPSIQHLRRDRVSSAAASGAPKAQGTPNRANISAPRTAVAAPAQPRSTKPISSSITTNANAISASTANINSSGGTLTAKDEQRIRREREEAAKKARAEASERGRAASREWAEKMRVREEERRRKAKMARMAKMVVREGAVAVAEEGARGDGELVAVKV